MFIGRRLDGSIYGLWTVRQSLGQEELPDDHQDVIAFSQAQANALTNTANAKVAGRRNRSELIEELERRMSLGAPQGEVNSAILNLLKE